MFIIRWLIFIIVYHPKFLVTFIGLISTTCLILTLFLKSIPDFKEPQLGFSTRGTSIANRLIAWQNIIKSIDPVGPYTQNPKEYRLMKQREQQTIGKSVRPFNSSNSTRKSGTNHKGKKVIYGKEVKLASKNDTNWIDMEKWRILKSKHVKSAKKLAQLRDDFFCGSPDSQYAKLVIASEDGHDLFNAEDLIKLCHLQKKLTKIKHYKELCVQDNNKKPCIPWSLTNYVAYFSLKSSCNKIKQKDVEFVKTYLANCSTYFHSSELASGSDVVPLECRLYDSVFNVFNYINPITFLPANGTSNDTKVTHTMVFLPLASSTAIMPYYRELIKSDLTYNGFKIVAMDMGLKDSLFDEYLVWDLYLVLAGALFVFCCIWFYTESLILTLVSAVIIFMTLNIAYFVYAVVLDINFFPFMNLLTVVVVLGIGSDDAFILCKIWNLQKMENCDNEASLELMMSTTFKHALVTLFVTTLTTAVAFLGSYASYVTAVSCFSLFTGVAVIINFILMITWFPAFVVLYENSRFSKKSYTTFLFKKLFRRSLVDRCKLNPKDYITVQENVLTESIIQHRYIWFLLLLILMIAGLIILFVYPKIEFPNSSEFQLFKRSHPFEQYDFVYKTQYWFVTKEMMEYRMPMRFVFGVKAEDNGRSLDPTDLGTLEEDSKFDITAPSIQVWFVEFCRELRSQNFYHLTQGPLLMNCFLETFMNSMDIKCEDGFSGKNRTPCCNASKFPFGRDVFDKCILEEIADIYKTPNVFAGSFSSGPIFSKEQNATIKVAVVEYDSNFIYSMSFDDMNHFYQDVTEWMTKKMEAAPKAIKDGWFISDLGFYDLQRELRRSTEVAVGISLVLALAVLFCSTRSILISLYSIFAISSAIVVTMASLVLLGWQLNVLESTALSTAIGLTVDFSLHYAINYRRCPKDVSSDRKAATRYALNHMAGPSFMAAVTTGSAGAFMIPSIVLPYVQMGIFLALVMVVSWIYSTCMLGSMLAIVGPVENCCKRNGFGANRHAEIVLPEPLCLSQEEFFDESYSHELDSLATSTRQDTS
ncbi:protein dispatched isoform X1 [Diabrotica undecimpunctata]|uniref:protein dispatched isoform X1 n=2 Tax=Diabrotica undecimpunctata TaxID=50387 RepID=UPI003B63AD4B